ncbi:hypothetical protein MAP00_005964 [Monascus purpureus]|nr:hypothetical protein MAP00_005964 [Monascus purpureus]
MAQIQSIDFISQYAYSAWAPQFAQKMRLSSTESNLIGVAGNLGMYSSGIPLGLLTDSKGPRISTFLGSVTLITGYYPIYLAYERGPGSLGIFLLCLFAFLTGLGGSSAFSASIKTSAANFPNHRGSATAFPLAAFGLSALFWSTVSTIVFKGDTGRFLLLLALGTCFLTFASIPFLRILPLNDSYLPVSRRFSGEHVPPEPSHRATGSSDLQHIDFEIEEESDEPDVRGLAMLPKIEFWQLFLTMALLSGIGLMTINNIGNSARALWKHKDNQSTPQFIQQKQVVLVSVLSFGNFIGRLCSGIGSDVMVKKLSLSRFWCLFASSVVFTMTQLAGSAISDPHKLTLVAGLTGLAYGFLFGVFPSLVAHTFGIGGLSQNFGVMTLAPIFSGNIFNILYGTIYDRHSVVDPTGVRDCPYGLACYQTAYYTTFFSGVTGMVVCFLSIMRERQIHGSFRKIEHSRLA